MSSATSIPLRFISVTGSRPIFKQQKRTLEINFQSPYCCLIALLSAFAKINVLRTPIISLTTENRWFYATFAEFRMRNVANTLQTHGFSLLFTTPQNIHKAQIFKCYETTNYSLLNEVFLKHKNILSSKQYQSLKLQPE